MNILIKHFARLYTEAVKDYELVYILNLVEILYSDVIQSCVVSLGVTLRTVVRKLKFKCNNRNNL